MAPTRIIARAFWPITLALVSSGARAQVVERWHQQLDLGGPAASVAAAMGTLSNGDVVLAVGISDAYPQPVGFQLRRIRPDGSLVWSVTQDAPPSGGEDPHTLAVDPDDRIYVGGSEFWPSTPGSTTGTGRTEVWTFDSTGALLGSAATATSASNLFSSARVDDLYARAGGEVYAAGSLPGATSSLQPLWYGRIDATGSFVWTVEGTTASHRGAAIGPAPGGDVYVASMRTAGSALSIHVERVTSAGVQVWQIELPMTGFGGDRVAMTQDASGNLYVALQRASDVLVVALDSNGTQRWTRSLAGGSNLFGPYLEIDPFGRLVVGWTRFLSETNLTASVLDTTNGNVAWTTSLVSTRRDQALGMGVDDAGDITVFGYRYILGTLEYRVIAATFDPAGGLRWQFEKLPPPGNVDIIYGTSAARGDELYLAGSTRIGTSPGVYDLALSRLDRTARPFCFGDGSGTACPCGASVPTQQRGCPSSLGLAGRLVDGGVPNLSNDTLILLGSAMPNSSALYFQGTTRVAGGAGAVFGDGLRCAGGTTQRLGTKSNAGGASQYPSSGDASVSVRGGVTSPGSRTYQVWYRNSDPTFCTPDVFNLTNGLDVAWVP